MNRARDLFLRETDTEGIEFIENAIQQNLSDGLLYKQVADMLYGIHTIKQSLHPAIYLERIAQYYERAMELLPTEAEDISYSLVSIYANLSEYSKAEAAWNRLPESKYDKAWAHAEMLCAMQSYKTAIPEIKNIVLRQIISLSDKLNYLKDILSLTGDKDAAQLAETKAAELRDVFDLWEGFDKMSQLTSAIVCSDTDAEINHLTDFLRLNTVNKQISGCPLFSDVTLGKTSEKCKTSADLMAEILRSLQKRTN